MWQKTFNSLLSKHFVKKKNELNQLSHISIINGLYDLHLFAVSITFAFAALTERAWIRK